MAGYVAAIGFFRTSQLDTLSSLASVPVANLLFILVGMPLIAILGGWLLAGRSRPRSAAARSTSRQAQSRLGHSSSRWNTLVSPVTFSSPCPRRR